MLKVKVAIIGVGNYASLLVQEVFERHEVPLIGDDVM
jgi:myo-inositol-1-phosphate synthase